MEGYHKGDASGKSYAVKNINICRCSPSSVTREVNALRLAKGIPNIVQMHKAQMLNATEVSIVMELLEGLEGSEFYEELSDEWWKPEKDLLKYLGAIFRELIVGLQGLHKAGIIHSDMKWENIHLGADGRVTIVDLGLSVGIGEEVWGSTLKFAPPGYYNKNEFVVASEKFDAYQLGRMLHFFLTKAELKIPEEMTNWDEMAEYMTEGIEDSIDELKLWAAKNADVMGAITFMSNALLHRMPLEDLLQTDFIVKAKSKPELTAWLKTEIPKLMNK